jgi:hypothetical protein
MQPTLGWDVIEDEFRDPDLSGRPDDGRERVRRFAVYVPEDLVGGEDALERATWLHQPERVL